MEQTGLCLSRLVPRSLWTIHMGKVTLHQPDTAKGARYGSTRDDQVSCCWPGPTAKSCKQRVLLLLEGVLRNVRASLT